MKRLNVGLVGAWNRNAGDRALQAAVIQQVNPRGVAVEWWCMDCQERFFDPGTVANLGRKLDAVIVGPGGLLWNRPGTDPVSGWQWNIPTDVLRDDWRIPFAVYGIGTSVMPYGDTTVEHPEIRRNLEICLAKAVRFSVRLPEVKVWMEKELGLDVSRVTVASDPTLGLKVFRPWRPDQIDMAEGEQGGDAMLWREDRLTIGVSLATDKPERRFEDGFGGMFRMVSALGAALQKVVEETDAQVVFIPHIAEIDRWAVQLLKDSYLGARIISTEDFCPGLYRPMGMRNAMTLAGLYERFDAVVGGRKHALWLAARAAVPAVALGEMKDVEWTANALGFNRFPNVPEEGEELWVKVAAETIGKMAMVGQMGGWKRRYNEGRTYCSTSPPTREQADPLGRRDPVLALVEAAQEDAAALSQWLREEVCER